LLRKLPRAELKRVRDELLEKYYGRGSAGEADAKSEAAAAQEAGSEAPQGARPRRRRSPEATEPWGEGSQEGSPGSRR